MKSKQLIETTKQFVKNHLENAEGGHDWLHTERVYNTAMRIAQQENVDELTVVLAALLHDVADSKFHGGDDTIGPRIAKEFLQEQGVDKAIIDHVVAIIENVSFNKSLSNNVIFNSKALEVVQDADRLDAIGAIGIARCFNYGGYKNRKLYDPDIKPQVNMSREDYKTSKAPTINHFYEKLLLLKDKMNTKTGKLMAEERHRFMETFLKQFYKECGVGNEK